MEGLEIDFIQHHPWPVQVLSVPRAGTGAGSWCWPACGQPRTGFGGWHARFPDICRKCSSPARLWPAASRLHTLKTCTGAAASFMALFFLTAAVTYYVATVVGAATSPIGLGCLAGSAVAVCTQRCCERPTGQRCRWLLLGPLAPAWRWRPSPGATSERAPCWEPCLLVPQVSAQRPRSADLVSNCATHSQGAQV